MLVDAVPPATAVDADRKAKFLAGVREVKDMAIVAQTGLGAARSHVVSRRRVMERVVERVVEGGAVCWGEAGGPGPGVLGEVDPWRVMSVSQGHSRRGRARPCRSRGTKTQRSERPSCFLHGSRYACLFTLTPSPAPSLPPPRWSTVYHFLN